MMFSLNMKWAFLSLFNFGYFEKGEKLLKGYLRSAMEQEKYKKLIICLSNDQRRI